MESNVIPAAQIIFQSGGRDLHNGQESFSVAFCSAISISLSWTSFEVFRAVSAVERRTSPAAV